MKKRRNQFIMFTLVLVCLSFNILEIGKSEELLAREPRFILNESNVFYEEVDHEQANDLITDNPKMLVLDVRSKTEYDDGHLKNAVNIEYDKIAEHIEKIDEHKEKPILVYCRLGNRSAIAVKMLQKKGFNKIYHMNNGIANWPYDLEK